MGDTIFAGTWGNGVYLSTNEGKSWTTVNSGLADTYVRTLTVSDSNLFAGTLNNSVWKRSLLDIAGSADISLLRKKNPVQFRSGYKNRTRSDISIEFSLPCSKKVAIVIYDMAGRKISTLVNKYLKAGSYEYFWDTHSFARGCYMVRFQSGAATSMKLIRIIP